ncbi:IclR family transcriptional regulator [uncultured Sphaerochaeta sp.]|uniref:IclR family transcriptional regulator n=1 Tax=uncultured Sphaerochaeta sp. TaxID=886478 RepID=UPI002A0A585E|nr:IclR family transcriptional regulator [uncultured Sphaerochaeta sp.]
MVSSEHRTTERILDILETVSKHPDGMTLSEIGRALNAPKSSIFPLINTLNSRKFLTYNKREQRYFLGESIFILGNRYVNETTIIERIRKVLFAVCEQIQETLYFGILSDLDVLYLIKADEYSKFRVVSNPGNKLPAYSTGYGKALLSQFSEDEIRAFYPENTLKPITEHTIKTVDELNKQLTEIRRTGFSYEKGESTVGIQCVGIPVCHEGKILAGISIAVPEFKYNQERENQFKELLIKAKQEIEHIIATNRNQWNYSDIEGDRH